MKKIFRMMLLLTMMTTACVSMSSCSSDDNEEPEYVPVESAFSKLLKVKPVHQLSYSHTYSGRGSFGLESDPQVGNYKTDYYTISFLVYNAPADDMYDGRYEIEQVGGSVWGWKEQWQPEYKKHELSTWNNNQPVKGAWAEIKTLDKGDEYGKKTFRVKLHVDEMTEKNGDYARNINISFTGRDTGPMLVN
ncbi:hypothetical protein [Leyella stercorea]|uniref:hypothetical protein n=1 Tax=Leyella stercorea TaxID=363265 RepID=UPI003F7F5665